LIHNTHGIESSLPGKTCPDNYDFSKSKTAIRYQRMRDALQKQNRTILYSLCEWGEMKVEEWGNATAMSWRSTGDINRKHLHLYNYAHTNGVL
jgi:alpha-galactosidase